MYVSIMCFVRMHVCVPCVWPVSEEAKIESITTFRTRVVGSFERTCKYGGSNLDLLGEKSMLLIAKLSFQPWLVLLFVKVYTPHSQNFPSYLSLFWDTEYRVGAVLKHSLCRYRLGNAKSPLRFCDPFIFLNMYIPDTHECIAMILSVVLS